MKLTGNSKLPFSNSNWTFSLSTVDRYLFLDFLAVTPFDTSHCVNRHIFGTLKQLFVMTMASGDDKRHKDLSVFKESDKDTYWDIYKSRNCVNLICVSTSYKVRENCVQPLPNIHKCKIFLCLYDTKVKKIANIYWYFSDTYQSFSAFKFSNTPHVIKLISSNKTRKKLSNFSWGFWKSCF